MIISHTLQTSSLVLSFYCLFYHEDHFLQILYYYNNGYIETLLFQQSTHNYRHLYESYLSFLEDKCIILLLFFFHTYNVFNILVSNIQFTLLRDAYSMNTFSIYAFACGNVHSFTFIKCFFVFFSLPLCSEYP